MLPRDAFIVALSRVMVVFPGTQVAFDPFVSLRSVHAYFSGHEHVSQQTVKKGISHFVCGGTGGAHSGFYGGKFIRLKSTPGHRGQILKAAVSTSDSPDTALWEVLKT